MIVYFEYSQVLSIGSEFEPISERSILAALEGGITDENKTAARNLVDSVKVEEAKILLAGLGFPYYVRLHFHNHFDESCEVEIL